MISFFVALAVLVIGYFVYGRITEKVFHIDDRKTPAVALNDGVDHVPMNKWKNFLIQLLNIAGTGPIFGALMGACFGPVVFGWIVLGSILGGAVHDYMSGMMSERNDGESIANLSGRYIGKWLLWIMRIFSVVLLVLCGTVFVTSPAELLNEIVPLNISSALWCVIILIYYFIATLVPIDKLIGRIYPAFGVLLIVMALAIMGGIIFSGDYTIPEFTFDNLHPAGRPIWPYMFVTVACGAISGFHSTQSPMVAKCIKTEKEGKSVFYGAMICEAVIALIWALAGVSFYETTNMLYDALGDGASSVVYTISKGILGKAGAVLAVVGVVVCPITSGDTAFRSARLIISETFHLDQKKMKNRLLISVPLLLIGGFLTVFAVNAPNGFDLVWRYFSWSNQTLAMITLWVASAYLIKEGKYKFGSLITAFPAAFMTAVCVTYIIMAKEGIGLDASIAYPIGIASAVILFIIYVVMFYRLRLRKV